MPSVDAARRIAADGRFLARVCVLTFRTRQSQMDACVEDIEFAVRRARQ